MFGCACHDLGATGADSCAHTEQFACAAKDTRSHTHRTFVCIYIYIHQILDSLVKSRYSLRDILWCWWKSAEMALGFLAKAMCKIASRMPCQRENDLYATRMCPSASCYGRVVRWKCDQSTYRSSGFCTFSSYTFRSLIRSAQMRYTHTDQALTFTIVRRDESTALMPVMPTQCIQFPERLDWILDTLRCVDATDNIATQSKYYYVYVLRIYVQP